MFRSFTVHVAKLAVPHITLKTTVLLSAKYLSAFILRQWRIFNFFFALNKVFLEM